MNRTPSLCGGFLIDKRSMVAFTWSITTVLTLFAFITAVVLSVKVHAHYNYLQNKYEGDDWYKQNEDYYNYYDDDGSQDNKDDDHYNGDNSHDEKYREQVRESVMLLSSMSAKSITFVAVYTMILAAALSCYGSMAIVGFTSLRGVYINPCFSIGSNKLRVGIFGGAIVVFANLLLVCAVVLSEVKVADNYYNNQEEEEEEEEENNADGEYTEPYQVEQIAAILSVTCIFLSALYTIFAVLLFLCHAGEEQSILRIEQGRGGVGIGTHLNHSRLLNNHHQSGMNRGHLETVDVSHMGASGKTTPLVVSNVVNDVGQVQTSTLVNSAEGFITIENSSQGTSD